MLKLVTFCATVFALLAAVPSAAAGTVEAILDLPEVGHENHQAEVPESGRLLIPIDLKLKLTDVVCAQKASFKVQIHLTGVNDIVTYGASPEPEDVTVSVESSQTGPGEKIIESAADLGLGTAWNAESRPKTGAQQVYTLTPEVRFDSGGPCLPPYETQGQELKVYTKGVDMPDDENATAGPNCATNPELAECLVDSTAAPPAEAPNAGVALMMGALVVAFVLRRRRA